MACLRQSRSSVGSLGGCGFFHFERNKLKPGSQSEKAPSLHVLTLGGSLIPTNPLPAPFSSALIDVCRHWNIRMSAAFVPIYLLFRLCRSVLFNLWFILLMLPWSLILFELHLSATATGTHHLDERTRVFFNVGGTFKLHELVIVLWLCFTRLIENCLEYWCEQIDTRERGVSCYFCFYFGLGLAHYLIPQTTFASEEDGNSLQMPLRHVCCSPPHFTTPAVL